MVLEFFVVPEVFGAGIFFFLFLGCVAFCLVFLFFVMRMLVGLGTGW